jgi:predicted DNA-binding WGR domain protein
MTGDITVEVTELSYREPPSNKFYRTFVVGDHWVAQWGRIGTVGQFKVNASASADVARTQATAQCATKLAKGYSRVASATFAVPGSWLTGLMAHTSELDDLFRSGREVAVHVGESQEPPAAQSAVARDTSPNAPAVTGMEAKLRAALAKARAAQS